MTMEMVKEQTFTTGDRTVAELVPEGMALCSIVVAGIIVR
jgi:hypothetical protein